MIKFKTDDKSCRLTSLLCIPSAKIMIFTYSNFKYAGKHSIIFGIITNSRKFRQKSGTNGDD